MKKKAVIFLAGILVCSMLVPVYAKNKNNAQLRSDFTIVIDGEECVFTRADGSVALPILYNNTTYLPLRAIGEVMGKNVNWDETTKTITLSGNREQTTESMDAVATEPQEVMVQVQERGDFLITIDGVTNEFKTAAGDKINPIVYNGSTYLPLRAIGQIMGKEVAWDNATKKVTLAPSDSTVTDADSFTTEEAVDTDLEQADIGMGKAKEIAVANANLNEKDVCFLNTKVAEVEGKKAYQVAFYFGMNEYDYEIEAITGAILSVDSEIEDFDILTDGKFIHTEKPEKAALDHANVKNSEATFTLVALNEDGDRVVYKVAFFTASAEYDYTIDATSSEVINFEMLEKEADAGDTKEKNKNKLK
ncbi:MAG: stalk domain-containing protein [Anaerotignum sp.]|nr:stalk domain-containing protein [Anaerotignum sp.]